jgi:hypothetical protein
MNRPFCILSTSPQCRDNLQRNTEFICRREKRLFQSVHLVSITVDSALTLKSIVDHPSTSAGSIGQEMFHNQQNLRGIAVLIHNLRMALTCYRFTRFNSWQPVCLTCILMSSSYLCPCLLMFPLSFRLSNQMLLRNLCLHLCVLHILPISFLVFNYHSIKREVKMLKFLIMQFSPVSYTLSVILSMYSLLLRVWNQVLHPYKTKNDITVLHFFCPLNSEIHVP